MKTRHSACGLFSSSPACAPTAEIADLATSLERKRFHKDPADPSEFQEFFPDKRVKAISQLTGRPNDLDQFLHVG